MPATRAYRGGMARVPLFPLGTVLVPGATLPLQVFEPRYVVMLSDLLNSMDVPEFGVVAIRQGHEVGAGSAHDLHDVGCLARVTQAASLGDGRYLVVSTGVRRFHLEAVDPGTGAAYTTGEVTILEERTGDEQQVADLAVRLRKALDTYATTVGAEEQEWAQDPAELSYEVGAAVGLDLLDRQRLLAADDTETRLRLALHLVRREQGLASTMRLVPPPPDRPYNLN